MDPHYRNIALLILAALALSILVGYLAPQVDAQELTGITADEFNATPPPTPEPTPAPIPKRIEQGDYVYVGEYYDIAGVTGWPDDNGEFYLAYCNGGLGCYSGDAGYLLHLPGKYKSGTVASQYRFFIDPEVFGNRTGVWEQWDGEYERAGNTVAFKVALTRPPTNVTPEETVTPEPTPEIPLVPPKRISDFLVAKGDGFNLSISGPAKLWVFGNLDGIYDADVNLTPKQIMDLDTGNYELLVQQPGRNTIYEASYSPSDSTLVSPWRNVPTEDVSAITPPMVKDKLIGLLGKGDDEYAVYDMVVEPPSIEITSMDEIYVGSLDVLDVRGYTNVAPGTILSFTLDEEKATTEQELKERTVITETLGEFGGYERFFQVYIPINYDMMTQGQHTVIGRTPLGGDIHADFYISILPDDSYKPNASLKYIQDRNPFVPTPTPEVIREVVTQKIVETIYIPVTPSDAQVYAQQKAAADATAKEFLNKALVAGFLIIVGILGLAYGISVIRRARQ